MKRLRALASTALLHLLARRLALHERHDMIRNNLNLSAEVVEAHAAGKIWRQNLDDYAAIESDLARGKDRDMPPARSPRSIA